MHFSQKSKLIVFLFSPQNNIIPNHHVLLRIMSSPVAQYIALSEGIRDDASNGKDEKSIYATQSLLAGVGMIDKAAHITQRLIMKSGYDRRVAKAEIKRLVGLIDSHYILYEARDGYRVAIDMANWYLEAFKTGSKKLEKCLDNYRVNHRD
jgi:hypothetical protein